MTGHSRPRHPPRRLGRPRRRRGRLAAPGCDARPRRRCKWRMVTSWPKNLPGPGVSAQRLAERIRTHERRPAGRGGLRGGRDRARLRRARRRLRPASPRWATPPRSSGRARRPAAALFTTAPFGMGPVEHLAWIQQRGGQALWDRLYEPFKVRGFLAGNTGPSMGGWFRKEVKDVGRRGGAAHPRAGARRRRLPGARRDAAWRSRPATSPSRWSAARSTRWSCSPPSTTCRSGCNRHAPFYYAPGFNKPNGAAEALVSLAAWDALPPGPAGHRAQRLRGGARGRPRRRRVRQRRRAGAARDAGREGDRLPAGRAGRRPQGRRNGARPHRRARRPLRPRSSPPTAPPRRTGRPGPGCRASWPSRCGRGRRSATERGPPARSFTQKGRAGRRPALQGEARAPGRLAPAFQQAAHHLRGVVHHRHDAGVVEPRRADDADDADDLLAGVAERARRSARSRRARTASSPSR